MNTGIYKIINKITGSFYIGSTKNLKTRKGQHFSDLKHGKSNCKILQNAVNKYGLENFEFKIISFCSEENLFKLEQFFVDTLNPKYNICKLNVSVPIGVPHVGYIITDMHREKRRIDANRRLKEDTSFGWKSRVVEELDNHGEVVRVYNSLKEFAQVNNCAIGNVGTCLKNNHKCKGKIIRYQVL